MKNSFEIWRMADRNCCNSITDNHVTTTRLNRHHYWFRDWQVRNWPIVSHLQLAGWCHQWLTECSSCAQAFCRRVFLGWYMFVQSVIQCVFFSVATVNIFSSMNKMTLMSLDAYFSAIVSNGWVCIAVHFTQFRSVAIFQQKNISQTTDAFEGWWDPYLTLPYLTLPSGWAAC